MLPAEDTYRVVSNARQNIHNFCWFFFRSQRIARFMPVWVSDVSRLYFGQRVDSKQHIRSDSMSLGGYSANMASGALIPLAGAVYPKLMESCPPLDQPNETTLVGSGLTVGPASDRVGNVSVAHFKASQQSVIGPSDRVVSGTSR